MGKKENKGQEFFLLLGEFKMIVKKCEKFGGSDRESS